MTIPYDPLVEAGDYGFLAKVTSELYRRRMIPVQYIRLDRNQSVDTLYNEKKNPVFLPPISINAFISRPDDSQELLRYGLDRDVARKLYIPRYDTDQVNLTPEIGDKIQILGTEGETDELEVMVVNKEQFFFVNINKILSWELVCRYYRIRNQNG